MVKKKGMKLYDVRDYGAVGDGITDSTMAIQTAVDACHHAGGGTVRLSAGEYVAGTLYLKSFVCLHVDVSARLLASKDKNRYGMDTHYNRYVNEKELDPCFLYAEDAHDIILEGDGEICGQGEAFLSDGGSFRPMMIRFLRCSHVKLRNLKLYQSASWTTAFLDSSHIWIDSLDIWNDKNYNGDGLDFDGCSDVFVSNCQISGTDDNLCLQASSPQYPVKNVHISNCHFTSVCAGIRIGLKSVGNIKDVIITGCTFEAVLREGIKIECTEGGCISDIVIQGISMHNVRRPVFILLNNRLDKIGSSIDLDRMPSIGSLERILISGLTATDDREMKHIHYRFQDDVMGSPGFNGIRVDAHRDHPICGLTLRDVYYTCIGGVKEEEIPGEYPPVYDYLTEAPDSLGSENYYPDWSRTTFMDIRNVKLLTLDHILFRSLEQDTRSSWKIEGCSVLKQEIYEW